MKIKDISCQYKEYRLVGKKWILYSSSQFLINELAIINMYNASPYFTSLGGYMKFYRKPNRRFGNVISKIISVSICKTIKKVYILNYNQALV